MLHFELFDRRHHNKSPKTGVSVPSNLNDLRKLYTNNVEKIKTYYESKKFSVQNRNIISQMLDHFDLMLDASLEDFVFVNSNDLGRYERTFNFTTIVNKGKIHPPYLYANGGSTILLSDYDNRGINLVSENWKTYPCIQVLLHSRNDMKMLLPNDIDDGSKGGICVVSINLIALMIKYREFVKEQMLSEEDVGTRLNKNVFVSRYVIPDIVESDLDHRVLNRLIDRFYGVREVTPRFKHPFIIHEPYYKLNKMLDDILITLSSKDMTFDSMLRNIPLFCSMDAGQLLTYDDVPDNRNCNWAYVVTRLRVMCFLYDIAKSKTMNSTYIGSWKIMIERMQRDNSLVSGFPYFEKTEVLEYIEKIKAMTF